MLQKEMEILDESNIKEVSELDKIKEMINLYKNSTIIKKELSSYVLKEIEEKYKSDLSKILKMNYNELLKLTHNILLENDITEEDNLLNNELIKVFSDKTLIESCIYKMEDINTTILETLYVINLIIQISNILKTMGFNNNYNTINKIIKIYKNNKYITSIFDLIFNLNKIEENSENKIMISNNVINLLHNIKDLNEGSELKTLIKLYKKKLKFADYSLDKVTIEDQKRNMDLSIHIYENFQNYMMLHDILRRITHIYNNDSSKYFSYSSTQIIKLDISNGRIEDDLFNLIKGELNHKIKVNNIINLKDLFGTVFDNLKDNFIEEFINKVLDTSNMYSNMISLIKNNTKNILNRKLLVKDRTYIQGISGLILLINSLYKDMDSSVYIFNRDSQDKTIRNLNYYLNRFLRDINKLIQEDGFYEHIIKEGIYRSFLESTVIVVEPNKDNFNIFDNKEYLKIEMTNAIKRYGFKNGIYGLSFYEYFHLFKDEYSDEAGLNKMKNFETILFSFFFNVNYESIASFSDKIDGINKYTPRILTHDLLNKRILNDIFKTLFKDDLFEKGIKSGSTQFLKTNFGKELIKNILNISEMENDNILIKIPINTYINVINICRIFEKVDNKIFKNMIMNNLPSNVDENLGDSTCTFNIENIMSDFRSDDRIDINININTILSKFKESDTDKKLQPSNFTIINPVNPNLAFNNLFGPLEIQYKHSLIVEKDEVYEREYFHEDNSYFSNYVFNEELNTKYDLFKDKNFDNNTYLSGVKRIATYKNELSTVYLHEVLNGLIILQNEKEMDKVLINNKDNITYNGKLFLGNLSINNGIDGNGVVLEEIVPGNSKLYSGNFSPESILYGAQGEVLRKEPLSKFSITDANINNDRFEINDLFDIDRFCAYNGVFLISEDDCKLFAEILTKYFNKYAYKSYALPLPFIMKIITVLFSFRDILNQDKFNSEFLFNLIEHIFLSKGARQYIYNLQFFNGININNLSLSDINGIIVLGFNTYFTAWKDKSKMHVYETINVKNKNEFISYIFSNKYKLHIFEILLNKMSFETIMECMGNAPLFIEFMNINLNMEEIDKMNDEEMDVSLDKTIHKLLSFINNVKYDINLMQYNLGMENVKFILNRREKLLEVKKYEKYINQIGNLEIRLLKANEINLALKLGNITECCQRLGSAAETCVVDGLINPYSGFIIARNKDTNKILAQSYAWLNFSQEILVLDNIELNRSNSTDLNSILVDLYYEWAKIQKYRVEVGSGFNGLHFKTPAKPVTNFNKNNEVMFNDLLNCKIKDENGNLQTIQSLIEIKDKDSKSIKIDLNKIKFTNRFEELFDSLCLQYPILNELFKMISEVNRTSIVNTDYISEENSSSSNSITTVIDTFIHPILFKFNLVKYLSSNGIDNSLMIKLFNKNMYSDAQRSRYILNNILPEYQYGYITMDNSLIQSYNLRDSKLLELNDFSDLIQLVK